MTSVAAAATTVVVLGGWSPGPLEYLLKHVYRQHSNQSASFSDVTVMTPSIPMPPVGCSWLWDRATLALVIVLVAMKWSFHAVVTNIQRKYNIALLCIVILVMGLVLMRLCVAWLVRNCLNRGIEQARRCLERSRATSTTGSRQHNAGNNNHNSTINNNMMMTTRNSKQNNTSGGYPTNNNVEIVIGFSWGGAVVAEMVRRGLLGNKGQPKALLIAPTTALVSSVGLMRDPALKISLDNDNNDNGSSSVYVFHATHDGCFCPHAHRWEQSRGVAFTMLHDCHIFVEQNSKRALTRTLYEMMQQTQQDP